MNLPRPPRPSVHSATVRTWQLAPDALLVGLDDGHGLTHVRLPIEPGDREALAHVHPATPECAGASEALADVLIRALGAAHGRLGRLVLDLAGKPVFHLEVVSPVGEYALPLDLVPAASLLASGRVLVDVSAAAWGDWDEALHALLRDHG